MVPEILTRRTPARPAARPPRLNAGARTVVARPAAFRGGPDERPGRLCCNEAAVTEAAAPA